MGIHDGHRERLRQRFLECGFNGVSDHNILEMILIYAIPRRDTNDLAHVLIDRFGTLAGVLEADMDDLKSVKGLGDNAVILLKMFTQVNKRYLEEKSNYNRQLIDGVKTVADYFAAKFLYETNESVYALFLDNKNGVIDCRLISSGIVNATDICIRQLAETSLRCGASSIILAHNHPDGNIKPSNEDIQSTGSIKKALGLVGVTLLDHVVVGNGTHLSMSNMWLLD